MDNDKVFGEEIVVKRFDKDTAYHAHQDTILADLVVPEELKCPFWHQYGYLTKGNTMELHKHPTDEIYIVYSGQLTVTVDDEQEVVEAGDVIAIPPNLMHTMTALSEEAVWAALWWEHI